MKQTVTYDHCRILLTVRDKFVILFKTDF